MANVNVIGMPGGEEREAKTDKIVEVLMVKSIQN